MATQYPTSIDTTVTLPLVFDLISPVMADDHNRLRTAIVAIENELGVAHLPLSGERKRHHCRKDEHEQVVKEMADIQE